MSLLEGGSVAGGLAAALGSLPALDHLSQVFLACMLSSGPQIVVKEAAVLGDWRRRWAPCPPWTTSCCL